MHLVTSCGGADTLQVFRVDRVLDVTPGEAFEPPADFDAADFITEGRVYHPGEELEVVVRYSGSVAPWLLERDEGELQDDGGVIVRDHVSDPDWIVRHVLQYGLDARVWSRGAWGRGCGKRRGGWDERERLKAFRWSSPKQAGEE